MIQFGVCRAAGGSGDPSSGPAIDAVAVLLDATWLLAVLAFLAMRNNFCQEL